MYVNVCMYGSATISMTANVRASSLAVFSFFKWSFIYLYLYLISIIVTVRLSVVDVVKFTMETNVVSQLSVLQQQIKDIGKYVSDLLNRVQTLENFNDHHATQ